MADAEAPVPPLVVGELWDLTFHRSVGDVLSYYEPWFPDSAEYVAFDSCGHRLRLYTDRPLKRRKVFGPIWTDNAHELELRVGVEPGPAAPEELRSLLTEWLRRVGEDDLTGKSVRELIEKCVDRGGWTP